jgi:aminoglycoside phosphotransferase (APT) family kinase protein
MSALAMLSLAPDPLFAQRDALLDEEELRARLSVLLDENLDACTRVRATYHPGRSLRLLLRVSNDRLVAARAYAPGASRSRFEHARAAAGDNVRHDEELATVFFLFPADRKLAALARLDNGSWPRIPGAGAVSYRLVAYSPERAATAVAEDGRGRQVAFVKLHAGGTAGRTVMVHRALRARGLHTPAVLAAWPALSAFAVDPAEGERLDGTGWDAFGRTLARLHSLAPVDRRRLTRLDVDSLRDAAATITALRPDVASAVYELEDALRSSVPGYAPAVCVHGDAHPKNVVVDGEHAALVDLDDVAGGAAAADVGSVLAGIRVDALLGRRDPSCADAFLDGYGLHDLVAVRWYTAAALLRERALRSITRLRAEGLERMHDVLAAAREELG